MDYETRAQHKLNGLLSIAADRGFTFLQGPPKLVFTSGYLRAGQACERTHTIELNREYFEDNAEDMLENTLPHELAHLIAFKLFPRHTKEGNIHGAGWQLVMWDWFGLEPERLHNYDTSNISARRQARFTYRCACQERHQVSTVIHNKIQRGQQRFCRTCGAILHFVPMDLQSLFAGRRNKE